MKRFYECTFIVNPGLDDGQIENTVKMAEDTIVKNGGAIVNIEHIGRRRLAYPITKKHNGYYISVEFEAEGRIIEKVERFLTLDENVMRYLTVNLDARELEAKRTRVAFAAQDRGKDGPANTDKPAETKTETPAGTETKAETPAETETKAEAPAEKTETPVAAKAEETDEAKADAVDAPDESKDAEEDSSDK
jgi:small subunit ribosomal protein S6